MKIANLSKITAIVLLSFLLFQSAKAQSLTSKQTDSLKKIRAENVFIELAGPGLLFSGNYDTRFSNKRDGLGARIGFGYAASDGTSFTSVPIQLNYLLGKNGKYFEVGAGLTYTNFSVNSDVFSFSNSQSTTTKTSTVLGTMTFGYRSQPIDGGFNFRASFNPIITSTSFLPSFGLSFGYTF